MIKFIILLSAVLLQIVRGEITKVTDRLDIKGMLKNNMGKISKLQSSKSKLLNQFQIKGSNAQLKNELDNRKLQASQFLEYRDCTGSTPINTQVWGVTLNQCLLCESSTTGYTTVNSCIWSVDSTTSGNSVSSATLKLDTFTDYLCATSFGSPFSDSGIPVDGSCSSNEAYTVTNVVPSAPQDGALVRDFDNGDCVNDASGNLLTSYWVDTNPGGTCLETETGSMRRSCGFESTFTSNDCSGEETLNIVLEDDCVIIFGTDQATWHNDDTTGISTASSYTYDSCNYANDGSCPSNCPNTYTGSCSALQVKSDKWCDSGIFGSVCCASSSDDCCDDNPGAIAGLVIGVLVGVALAAYGLYKCCCSKKEEPTMK